MHERRAGDDGRIHTPPQIPERDAPPDVAALYDDIRRVTQVPLVNLIYRHMATLPGVLPWAWSLLRPLTLSGASEAAANRAVAALEVPQVTPFGERELRAAGVTDDERTTMLRVLAAYNRGNSLNVVNLTTLLLALDLPTIPRESLGVVYARADHSADADVAAIPDIRRLDDLDSETAARLSEIARLHGGDGVIPSLYLHLANWPGMLARVCDRVEPLLRDGAVLQSRDELCRLVDGEARGLLPLLATDVHVPVASLPALRSVLETFVYRLIPEMVPVGLALWRAMPEA